MPAQAKRTHASAIINHFKPLSLFSFISVCCRTPSYVSSFCCKFFSVSSVVEISPSSFCCSSASSSVATFSVAITDSMSGEAGSEGISDIVSNSSATFCPIETSSNSSSPAFPIGVSSKTVFSFKITVSKCPNGLFINSLSTESGVKETFVCPCISIRSPVLTSMLPRLSTPISLNVPNPFILTYLSCSSPSSITAKKVFTNSSASLGVIRCFSTSSSIKFCMFTFSFIAANHPRSRGRFYLNFSFNRVLGRYVSTNLGGTSMRCLVVGLTEIRSAFFLTSKVPNP